MAAQTADFEDAPQSRVRDTAPGNRKVSHKRGAGKVTRKRDTLVSYYGFLGLMVSTRNQADGMVIMGYAEPCADAWIELGKANPAVDRVLDIICVGGPFTAVLLLHGKLSMDLMKNHGTSPLSLFEQMQAPSSAAREPTGVEDAATPLPYTPAGPMAGTDTVLPSLVPMTEDQLRIIPDVGIPSDLDVQLRHLSRQPGGRPYEELKQEAMVLLAQQAAMANGHPQAPGSLGAPVMQE